MTTHTLSQSMNYNPMAAAMATLPTDKLSAIIAPPKLIVHSLLDFDTELATTPQAKRYALWCLGNSLNNFIIGNLQSHLRLLEREDREVNRPVDAPMFDEEQRDRMSEQEAAIEALRSKNDSLEEQGFEVQMPAIDVAEILVNLRSVIVHKLATIAAQTNRRDGAQSIGDSLAYRLSRAPAVNDTKVMRLHLATKIPVAALRKADLDNQLDDRAKLLGHAPRIIEMADELGWKHETVSDAEAEGLFDKLPVHTQYRLLGSVVKILNAAMTSEVRALLKFGRADSITNRVLIENVLRAYCEHLQVFTHAHVDELAAYEERGFALPTLDDLLADRV
jgi:hypothetical protein